MCSKVNAINDDNFWNQCTYDFSDITIQQAIEFYVLAQNFKILNLKLWLLERIENFLNGGFHFF